MSKGLRLFGRGLFVFSSGRCGDASNRCDWATPFLYLSLEDNHMSKTDSKNHIRNGIHRFYHQTSKLNLYVQNAKLLDMARVASELKQLSIQLNELSNQSQTTKGDNVSQEE